MDWRKLHGRWLWLSRHLFAISDHVLLATARWSKWVFSPLHPGIGFDHLKCPLEHPDIQALEKARLLKSSEQQHHTSQQQSCSSVLTSSGHEEGSDYIKLDSLASSSHEAESKFINREALFGSWVVCGDQSISPKEKEKFPRDFFDSSPEDNLSGDDMCPKFSTTEQMIKFE